MRSTLRTAFTRVERAVSVIAVLLAVVAGILSVVTNVEVTDQRNENAAKVACQTEINKEFLATIKERAVLSTENTKNLNDLVVASIKAKGNTAAQDQQIVSAYLTELAKLNGELAKATYPSIGDC